jgi:PAS domain S-box-containing protein
MGKAKAGPKPKKAADLRKRAEAALAPEPEDLSGASPEDVRQLVYELRIHQIELEMQNEELRRAQDELVAARDNYANLYDFAPVGYATLSDKGLILEANLTLTQMVGVSRRFVVKQRFSAFVLDDDEDIYYLHLRHLLDTNERQRCELRLRREGAEPFWAEVESVIVEDPNDASVRIRCVIDDVTEFKQAKRAERAAQEALELRAHLEEMVGERTAELERQAVELEAERFRAEEADRLKSEFLANMSHELRTPLNSIMGLSQLMISRGAGKEPKQETQYLEVIERNGRQLLNLINDILDLSKIEAGRTSISVERFVPLQIAEEVVELTRPLAQKRGLDLSLDVGELPVVFSDKSKVQQILLNLLSNAVKFTDQGGIEVIVTAAGGNISFAVKDTGIGIAESDMLHIFEAFRQADGSASREFEGTGLGLAICRKLAALLGGRILAESEPGAGSTFTLILPIRYPVPETPANAGAVSKGEAGYPSMATPPEAQASGKPVLVVEDNPDNLFTMKAILDNAGVDFVTAKDGREAVEVARAARPGLILMDVQLPGMSGLDAAKEIKADPALAATPIIALTAKAMRGDREHLLVSGCDDYISKPVDPAAVISTIGKWMTGEGLASGDAHLARRRAAGAPAHS